MEYIKSLVKFTKLLIEKYLFWEERGCSVTDLNLLDSFQQAKLDK